MPMNYLIYIFILTSVSLCNVSIGELAPNFKLQDQYEKTHILKDYIGKNVVIYFYPKDFTPGCTKQACSIRDINDILKDKDTVTLGISYDSTEKHDSFSKKHDLNFPLLCDSDKLISKLYDANGWFFPKRKTFIINKKGEISYIIDPVNVNTHNQIILSILDSLNTQNGN